MNAKETKDVLDFIQSLTADLAADKADGEITKLEYIRAALSNAPAAVKAFVGMDKIVTELKDISKEDLQVLVDEVMSILLNVTKLFLVTPK